MAGGRQDVQPDTSLREFPGRVEVSNVTDYHLYIFNYHNFALSSTSYYTFEHNLTYEETTLISTGFQKKNASQIHNNSSGASSKIH